MVNLIALAIPVFFALIGLEALVAWSLGRRVYRLTDALTDLSCGIGQQSTTWLVKASTLGLYVWVYEELAFFDLPEGAALWVGTFVALDFIYYLWHRFTHEVNIGWATHVVHHQSEDYNLAVALRQSLTSSLSSIPFYLPLALLGVPPLVFATCSALNTLYQFWIHTELIRSLGPLEWVMNTPSHHRVHHAVNPRYLDKNYAGVFIVWDRLLGTFVAEDEECVYGTVKPLDSYNPVWANVAWLGQLASDAAAANTWSDRLSVWFRAPGWRPAGLPALPGKAHERRADQVKYEPPATAAVAGYATAWFLPVTLATTGLLLVEDTAPTALLATLAALILTTTVAWGGLFERRSWALPVEVARIAGVVVAAIAWSPMAGAFGPALVMAAAGAAFASVAWLAWNRADLAPAPPLTQPG